MVCVQQPQYFKPSEQLLSKYKHVPIQSQIYILKDNSKVPFWINKHSISRFPNSLVTSETLHFSNSISKDEIRKSTIVTNIWWKTSPPPVQVPPLPFRQSYNVVKRRILGQIFAKISTLLSNVTTVVYVPYFQTKQTSRRQHIVKDVHRNFLYNINVIVFSIK